MKKRTFKLAVLGLMMTAVLFNCKKDNSDPSEPDTKITDALNAVTVATVTIDAPAAVVSTPATFTTSAAATEVNGALGGIAASGTVPASVSAASSAVSSAVSASDVATVNAVNSSTMDAVAAGGAVPADVKAILDKARANPALTAYLPKFTLPTVAGKTLTGTRIGSTDAIEKVEKVLVDDACVAKATAAFDAVKTKLDASKATQDAAVLDAYNKAIAPIASAQTTCTSSATTTYAGYRAAVLTQGNKALADIEAAKAVLGDMYFLLKALTNIAILDALSSINTLEAADKQACIAFATASTANATAARDANLAKVTAAYATALAEATKLKSDAIASCHNQGGGN